MKKNVLIKIFLILGIVFSFEVYCKENVKKTWSEIESLNSLIITKPVKAYKISSKTGGKNCYVYEEHVAIFREDPKSVGGDVFVFKKNGKYSKHEEYCIPKPENLVFSKPNKWANHFAGLYKNYLFIDSGTSHKRDLVIYDFVNNISSGSYDYDAPFRLDKDKLINDDVPAPPREIKKLNALPKCREQTPHELGIGQYGEEYRCSLVIDLKSFSASYGNISCQIRFSE